VSGYVPSSSTPTRVRKGSSRHGIALKALADLLEARGLECGDISFELHVTSIGSRYRRVPKSTINAPSRSAKLLIERIASGPLDTSV
jgi:hypothetical protein